jgi:hypothetical protein
MHSRSSESATPAHETPDPLAAVISLLRPQTVLSKVITGAGRCDLPSKKWTNRA